MAAAEKSDDIKSEFDNIKSLSEDEIKELLQRNYETIVDRLILENGILNYLYSRKVISSKNKETIKNQDPGSEQNEKLLDILETLGKDAIIQFFEALRVKGHFHVFNAVIEEQGKWTQNQSEEGVTERENKGQDYAKRLKTSLKQKYKDEMGRIRCNPFDPAVTQPIDELLVNLSLIQEDLDYAAGEEKKIKSLKDYCDIFEDQSEKEEKKDIRRILVKGSPGVGKTTFSKRLAFDWAEGKEKRLSERFENVFVLTLRNVTKGQTLVEAISEQLLLHKSPLSEDLGTYIADNEDKLLFVFDGLDEMQKNTSKDEIYQMIKRNYLIKTCLVLTSRPSEAEHRFESKIDQLARIEGFTRQDVRYYVKKFFGEKTVNDDVYEVSSQSDDISTALLKEIHEKSLSDIAKVPLILIILCYLYKSGKSLPENMSKIYRRLQQSLCERQKDEDLEETVDLEDILLKLGKIAFEGLMQESNQLFFSEKRILEEVGKDAFKVGLIWIEKAKYESEYNAYFLHKSFQESAAAFYLGKETDNDNDEPWEKLKSKVKTVKEIGEQDLLLQFCAGASQRLADNILDFLDEKAFENDPRLKIIVQSMDKLSHKKDLSTEELETVLDHYVDDHDGAVNDVIQILEFEVNYLGNMENPAGTKPHVANQVIVKTGNMKTAFQKKILKPANCIVTILDDQELEHLVKCTKSVSWINLEGGYGSPFSFTEKTLPLLEALLDANEHQLSVSIGEYCEAKCALMLEVIKLLKLHSTVKYKHFAIGSCYKKLGWKRVFEIMLGIRYLVALKLYNRGIPSTVLPTIGQIMNQNPEAFLQLDLTENSSIKRHFGSLSKEIEQSLPLIALKLFECLDASDTDVVKHLLDKCNLIKDLDVSKCECEISRDILKLKHLKIIDISETRNSDKEGLNVGQILAKLDKFKMLEVFKANNCQIDDSLFQCIPFNEPSKIRHISLDNNHIGIKGLWHLCTHHDMLPELNHISLGDNMIGDGGGQILLDHLKLFKNLKFSFIGDNPMSRDKMLQLQETMKRLDIGPNIWIQSDE